MQYSLVVEGGDSGFAANVQGSYNLFDPNAPPSGYLDGKDLYKPIHEES